MMCLKLGRRHERGLGLTNLKIYRERSPNGKKYSFCTKEIKCKYLFQNRVAQSRKPRESVDLILILIFFFIKARDGYYAHA